MIKRASISTLLCAVALATSLSAFAAPPAPKGAPPGYEAKWNQVVAAEKNEEYEKALTLLNEIPEDKQNVYTKLKKSVLLVRLGRFVEAEVILTALLKNPAADAIRPTIQGDLDDLRARMPRLTIRLAEGSEKSVWVTVDAEHVGPPVTIPINPGTHVILATRDGKEVFKQKVTLQDSQTLEVEIDASVVPPAQPVSHVSVPPTTAPTKSPAGNDESESPSGSKRAVPAFAAGVLFAGGSIASFLLMKSAESTAEANCASQHSFGCDDDAAGVGRIRTLQTLGWVSAGVAVAAVGVGVVLWTTAGPGKETRPVARATPLVGSNTFGLSFTGSF